MALEDLVLGAEVSLPKEPKIFILWLFTEKTLLTPDLS